MNDEDLAYQNAVRNLTSPFTQDSWNPIDWNWGYGWNQTKNFGNWMLGDKDFSPLNTGISLFNALAKYKDNERNYDLNLQHLADLKAQNIFNATQNSLSTVANTAMNLDSLDGFSKLAAESRANAIMPSLKAMGDSLASLGVNTTAFNNAISPINKYTNLKV